MRFEDLINEIRLKSHNRHFFLCKNGKKIAIPRGCFEYLLFLAFGDEQNKLEMFMAIAMVLGDEMGWVITGKCRLRFQMV